MRAYSRDDEERVRLQAQVREWASAGLIDAALGNALDAELRTDLRRTNSMLRGVLAFFTAIIIAAVAGFVVAFFQIRADRSIAWWLIIAATMSIVAAERLIANSRLYRFGVEEALAMMAVALGSLSVMLAAEASATALAVLAFAAVACIAVFARYGLVYAGAASLACAALMPFQLHFAEWIERTLAATVLLVAFVVARGHHLRHGDDYPGDESAVLQAAAWLGAYLVINVQITLQLLVGLARSPGERWFYWTTYLLTWAMPAVGLWLGLREKDRQFIRANLVLAIVTIATNKAYLGWLRHSWDPMILGALLFGVALVIRRWLASGPGAQRSGFTASRILEGDRNVVTALGHASALWQPHAAAPPDRSEPGFGGGRSGGGGATGSF
jgi:hypothetical protein